MDAAPTMIVAPRRAPSPTLLTLAACVLIGCGGSLSKTDATAAHGDGAAGSGGSLADGAGGSAASAGSDGAHGGTGGSSGAPATGGVQEGAPWPMLGGGAAHTARAASWVSSGPAVDWTFSAGGSLRASPAIAADGTIYALAGATLVAVRPDGGLRWTLAIDGDKASTPAIGADGTIYVGGSFTLRAVRPDGTQKWGFAAGGVIASSPAIAPDGTVYFTAADDRLHALDVDGHELWSVSVGDAGQPRSPAIGPDGTVYVAAPLALAPPALFAVASTGALKWKAVLPDAPSTLPGAPAVASDGTIYLVAGGHTLRAYTPGGTSTWVYTESGALAGPAIGADGTLYLTVDQWSPALVAVTPTGALGWTDALGDGPLSPPAIGGDGTIYSANYGALFAVRPDGTLMGTTPAQNSLAVPLAIGTGGAVYFGCVKMTLCARSVPPKLSLTAFDVAAVTARAAWSAQVLHEGWTSRQAVGPRCAPRQLARSLDWYRTAPCLGEPRCHERST